MRLHDWPERLTDALERIGDEKFEWGHSDCFTMGMDIVEALTGSDPWAAERGAYSSAISAARRLASNGFASLADFVASLGEQIPGSFAGRGDLGIVPGADGTASIVVCDGLGWIGRAEGRGFIRWPRSTVTTAIRIG